MISFAFAVVWICIMAIVMVFLANVLGIPFHIAMVFFLSGVFTIVVGVVVSIWLDT